jgi:hypothetical protein
MIRILRPFASNIYCPFIQFKIVVPVIYTFVYLTYAFCRGIFVLDITQFFIKMKTLTNRSQALFTNSNLLN